MKYMFVIDENKQPLNMCSTKTAEKLVKNGVAKYFSATPPVLLRSDIVADECVHEPLDLVVEESAAATNVKIIRTTTDKCAWSHAVLHKENADVTDPSTKALGVIAPLVAGEEKSKDDITNEVLSVVGAITEYLHLPTLYVNGKTFEDTLCVNTEKTPA